MARSENKGFTVAEVVVVIAVLGILSLVAIPQYNSVRRAALQSSAAQNARLVNAARDAYALSIPTAMTDWSATSTDVDRLQLLISAKMLAGSATDFVTMSGDYSVQLSGGIRDRTVLTHGGTPIDY
jgi:type IV pilus assembly protein PilA